jgi:hypothetical protein
MLQLYYQGVTIVLQIYFGDVSPGGAGVPPAKQGAVKIKMGEKVYSAMACLLFPPPLVALAILDSWHRLAKETHIFCAIVKGNDTPSGIF